MFDVDLERGLLIRRVAPLNHPQRLGQAVGCRGMDGYLKVRVGYVFYYVHRLIWAHVYGEWPDEIDHIDGDRANNRLNNLRQCSHSQNSHNRSRTIRNACGVKGVYVDKRNGHYRAAIRVDKRQIYIGQFRTLAEAALARGEAAKGLVGEFAKSD